MTYIFFTDETNNTPSSTARFFIYGGIFFPQENFQVLHDDIEDIRQEYGFLPDDPLKFNSASRPARVTASDHLAAKDAVLHTCAKRRVRLLVSLVSHNIAKGVSDTTQISWGANTILYGLHKVLMKEDACALCVMDRFPGASSETHSFMHEKFSRGLIFPDGRSVRLNRILSFSAASDGSSHASSAADIVIGALRFVVNERDKDRVGRTLIRHIERLLHYEEHGGKKYLRDISIFLRPKGVAVPAFDGEYVDLVAHLEKISADADVEARTE